MKENRESGAAETAVAIGIVRRGDCYLVGCRNERGPLPGYAEFPGGKCLPGESPEQCVVRECLEETGLTVAVMRRRAEITHNYPHERTRLSFFDCEPRGPDAPKPPFRWVPRDQLARLQFPEANRSILAEILGSE